MSPNIESAKIIIEEIVGKILPYNFFQKDNIVKIGNFEIKKEQDEIQVLLNKEASYEELSTAEAAIAMFVSKYRRQNKKMEKILIIVNNFLKIFSVKLKINKTRLMLAWLFKQSGLKFLYLNRDMEDFQLNFKL